MMQSSKASDADRILRTCFKVFIIFFSQTIFIITNKYHKPYPGGKETKPSKTKSGGQMESYVVGEWWLGELIG